jgi:hypothetical protein
MEQMRGFYNLLRQKPTSLFILLRWSSNLIDLANNATHISGIFDWWLSLLVTCLCWFLVHASFYPEDGGDKFLRNVGSAIYRNITFHCTSPATILSLIEVHPGFGGNHFFQTNGLGGHIYSKFGLAFQSSFSFFSPSFPAGS